MTDQPKSEHEPAKWYAGVTTYHWLVLAIASAGWVFDVFEGQLFNLTRAQMLPEILGVEPDHPRVKFFGDVMLAVFLVGGTVGGVLFGSLADRIGRRPTMVLTILVYSIFSGLTYFATHWVHVAVLRFLVAMGVGGEWAVAAALVAEVFPGGARAVAGGIFHASSVFGTWGASVVALAVGANWRYAYLIGIAPALLTLFVRWVVRESEMWQESVDEGEPTGNVAELLTSSPWCLRAVCAMLLAAVGLATFWGITVAGQDLARERLIAEGVSAEIAAERAKFAYGWVQTLGGGLGLVAFAPLANRFGRRRTFVIFHLGAVASVLAVCFVPQSYNQLLALLPVFGFLTLGMHAGYAIYFPELFPTRLRATGTSFGFNVGRLVAAPMLWFSGHLKSAVGLEKALLLLSVLYLVGLLALLPLPETKGRELIH